MRIRRTIAAAAATVGLLAPGLVSASPAAVADPYPSLEQDAWRFDSAGSLTGWTVRNASVAVTGGAARFTLTHRDPGIVSPDQLGLPADDYVALEFRLRNGADPTSSASADIGDEARLFFSTDADPTFTTAKSVTADIALDPAGLHVYRFDLSSASAWTGRIRQLRFDPTQGPTAGTVDLEYLKLVPVEGPVILTTEAQLERAQERIADAEEPFLTSWENTLTAADAALTTTYVPEQAQGTGYYFGLAGDHARAARDLALAYRMTGDRDYLTKAETILRDWAQDALASPVYPLSDSPHSAGLVIGRTVPIFADAYAMLYEDLALSTRLRVQEWFAWSLDPIRTSREMWENDDEICIGTDPCTYWGAPWYDRQEFNNHLSAQNLGILAIGYALQDAAVIAEALTATTNPRNLQSLIDGVILMDDGDLYHDDPTLTSGAPSVVPGETYDRYRISTDQGIHYAHLALRLLVLQAEIAENNADATDWFARVGADGENIGLAFDVYDDILLSMDSSAGTGYYAGSRIDLNLVGVYELARRHYPANTAIESVLEAFDRTTFDSETFGWSLALTHGSDGLDPAPHPYPSRGEDSWTFDDDASLVDWSFRNTSVAITGGVARATLSHQDPGFVSPVLGLDTADYIGVEFRMRNAADPLSSSSSAIGDQSVLFFSTDDARTFSSARSVTTSVALDPSGFHTYSFDLSSHPGWSGRLYQLRFDPTQGPTAGEVDLEFLRLIPAP